MPIEIIPFLFLGDYKDAEHLSLNTKLVVNCTKNIPFFSHDSKTNIRISVDDTPDDADILLNVWTTSDLFDNITNHIIQSQYILIHCQMGRQRSAATIAAFLMKTLRLSKNDAVQLIKSKKKEAFFPEPTFDNILTAYENYIS
jgi:predicted protein tyrosine phosphatase